MEGIVMVQSGDCAAHRPKRDRRLQAAAARGVFRKAVKFASSFELLDGPESIQDADDWTQA
jgi:hypothetical protein